MKTTNFTCSNFIEKISVKNVLWKIFFSLWLVFLGEMSFSYAQVATFEKSYPESVVGKYPHHILQPNDSTYLFDSEGSHFHLTKLDDDGNVDYSKSGINTNGLNISNFFLSFNSVNMLLYRFLPVAVGTNTDGSSGNSSPCFAMIHPSTNSIQMKLPYTNKPLHRGGTSLIQTKYNNHFVSAGLGTYTTSALNPYMMKTKYDGTVIWYNEYTDGNNANHFSSSNFPVTVIQKADTSGYVLMGNYHHNHSTYILNTNNIGSINWQYQYLGFKDRVCYPVDIIEASSSFLSVNNYVNKCGSIFIVGSSNGNLAGSFNYLVDTENVFFSKIIDSKDSSGDFIVSGFSGTNITARYQTYKDSLNTDSAAFNALLLDKSGENYGILLKIRSDATVIWARKYSSSSEIVDVNSTSDGGYALLGYTSDKNNVMVIKTDHNGRTDCSDDITITAHDITVSKVSGNFTKNTIDSTYSATDSLMNDNLGDSTICADSDSVGRYSNSAAIQGIYVHNNNYVSVFPNPNNGSMHINYALNSDAKMKIYNLMGKAVATYDLPQAGHRLNINRSELPAGVYFYKVSNGLNTSYSGKIVIIK